MSQAFPLDAIVHRVDRRSLPERLDPEQHLVIFDARARQVLPREPVVRIGKDIRYFLVSTRFRKVECQGPICKIKSPTLQASCELAVSYDARCETGREAQLVAALYDGAHPAAVLDAFVSTCVEGFLSGPSAAGTDPCLELAGSLPALAAYIRERCLQEIGISVEPMIRFPLREKLQTIAIKTGSFPVRVRDYDRQIELKLTTDVEVDDGNLIRALLCYHDLSGCEQRLKRIVQTVLIEDISLHRFCYELGGWVRQRLVESLNEKLWQEGRRITYLQLESPEIDRRPAELDEVEHSVDCHIRDYDAKIRVEHRLQLTVADLGTFRRSGVTDLRQWIGERLDTITRSVLFDLTYLDLLLDAGRVDIKSWMERESQAIGYQVKQLLTLPALDPLEWKETLPIESYEDTYLTTNSGVEVRLNIVIKGRIIDLRNERLKPYLTPNSKLADDMRGLIRRETQALMHTVDPERFYMRFDFSGEGETTLRQDIEARIKEALIAKFVIDRESLTVLAKPLETEITRRLSTLQERPHSLKVTTVPLRSRGQGESVEYAIDFRVEGVAFDHWYTFLSQRFESRDRELEEIKRVLGGAVQTAFNTIPRELLHYTNIKELKQLRQIASASAVRALVDSFGLVVSIVGVQRAPTPAESKALEVLAHDIDINAQAAKNAANVIADARVQELEILEKLRLEIETSMAFDDSPQLRDVVSRIAALNEEIAAYPLKQDKQHALPAVSDSAFDLGDYQRVLPAPKQTRQLEERVGQEKP